MQVVLFLFALTLATAAPAQSYDQPEACKTALAKPFNPELDPAFRPSCNSESFYYGIGRPIDYIAARKCAYVERAHPRKADSSLFYGSGVLSMVYANGFGTPANLDLATRFTCESGPDPGLLEKLEQDRNSGKLEPFDVCDFISGSLIGWCVSIDTRKQDFERNIKLERFRASLPVSAQSSFRQLQQAEKAFEDLRTRKEVDLSGTLRSMYELEEEAALRDQFLKNLQTLQKGPPRNLTGMAGADQELNITYAKLRKALPPTETQELSDFGTINFQGVRETERAWIKLRDSWVAFLNTAYPSYTPLHFIATLTEQRNRQLHDIIDPPDTP